MSKAQQAAIRPVTITYWAVDENISLLQTFAAEYRQFRPYVQISIRQVRADQLNELFVNALADDRAPDIISVPIRELPAYQSRLSPMPSTVRVANVYTTGGLSSETVVEPVVNALPTTQTIARTYIRPVEERVIVGGRVYGLPLSVDTMAVFVNRSILDASGVPELPDDWDTFTDAVKKTTRFNAAGNIVQSGVALGTANNIDNAFDILSLLWIQNNLPLERQGIAALSAGLNRNVSTHPTLQTVRFFSDFAKIDRDVYSWNTSFSSARDEFIRGRSAFYIGYASERASITAAAPQISLEIIPLPQLDPTVPKNIINFRIQSVVAKSQNQNEAWDFIRYITQAQNIQRYTDTTILPTPLRSQIGAQAEIIELAPFLQGILTASNWYAGRDVNAAKNALNVFLTAFAVPYNPDVEPNERDARLVDTFVRTVQQSQ